MRAGVRWSHAGVSRRALLAAPKGGWPTPEQRPVELPRLARPKGCFATHGGGLGWSIDGLSRSTTGRLGYIRPTTAHAIGGTAELALRYSYHLLIFRRAEPLQGATTGRTRLQEYGGNAVASAEAAGPFRDYGPGRSRRRRRRRRRRSTFQGLRAGWSGGRTKPEYPATSGRHDHATFRGAGRRVSPMYGTRSQQHVRRGTGRVTYRFMR